MSAITIKAIVFSQDGMWVAQCLDYNFVSCAEAWDELPAELLRQLRAQVEADLEAGKQPFHGYKPAPEKYWTLYNEVRARQRALRPRKGILERVREFVGNRIEAELFPVPVST